MEVPEISIPATGTSDPLADTRTQNIIDRLEAFDPNGRCVYKRVLVAVESSNLISPVWLYHYNVGHNAERIASGKWG